jgi:hypothetical protein
MYYLLLQCVFVLFGTKPLQFAEAAAQCPM